MTLPCHQDHFEDVLSFYTIEMKHDQGRYIVKCSDKIRKFLLFVVTVKRQVCWLNGKLTIKYLMHVLQIYYHSIAVPLSLPDRLLCKVFYTRYTPMYTA